ncbi:MAG: hypothetical protein WAW91_03675 [Candidatus Nanoperiomorbaceae bacterium]
MANVNVDRSYLAPNTLLVGGWWVKCMNCAHIFYKYEEASYDGRCVVCGAYFRYVAACYINGRGNGESEVMAFAKSQHLDDVKFIGQGDPNELWPLPR